MLTNIKIYVAGRSAELQKHLSKLGNKWYNNVIVKDITQPFIYCNADGSLEQSVDMEKFRNHEFKEMAVDEVLNISPDSAFKPFDKVLGRNVYESSVTVWSIDFFSHIRHIDGITKNVCLGSVYDECILYEENEHLLNTKDGYTIGTTK